MNTLKDAIAPKAIAPLERQSFLFSLVDGLASKEEEFLITFDSCTQGLPHFGGSAGDDLNLNKTYVFYDGKISVLRLRLFCYSIRCKSFRYFRSIMSTIH